MLTERKLEELMEQRRRRSATTDEVLEKAVESVIEYDEKDAPPPFKVIVKGDNILSTGSTLLDLAISGDKVRGGGVPGGILIEVYGRSGSGKTSILSELCGAAQSKGGEVQYLDPEARLDAEYSRIYGLEIAKEHYHKPDTVSEMFNILSSWKPKDPSVINVTAADSLAALSTELELEKGDKMGMRRAKEFSEGLRKQCRLIEEKNWLIVCSNQVRQGDYGDVTPGGRAVEFYSSLRISVNQVKKIEKEKKFRTGKIIKFVTGIESMCKITKSSIDIPFRETPIFITFNHGIDDVRGNLQYIKDMLCLSKYRAVDQEYQGMDQAIAHIEKENLENELREEVIDLWEEVSAASKVKRKKKVR